MNNSKNSIFIRLANDGDKVVGAFCGEPEAREVVWRDGHYEDFDERIHADHDVFLRVRINFYVEAESTMKIFEGSISWFKDLLRVRDKYGLDCWLFEIKRHGEARDKKTTYTILPEKKLNNELKGKIAMYKLHNLGGL